jgi:hypothetical protein
VLGPETGRASKSLFIVYNNNHLLSLPLSSHENHPSVDRSDLMPLPYLSVGLEVEVDIEEGGGQEGAHNDPTDLHLTLPACSHF